MKRTDDLTDCRPLICSGRLPYTESLKVFRKFYANYPRYDIHLLEYAREHVPAALPMVVRILTEVSDGSRLLMTLISLFENSTDRRLRAQLAFLIARTFHNRDWAVRALEEPDARLRANVIEGIRAWSRDIRLPLQALNDTHHRVVCNACVSLAMLGHPKGRRTLYRLLEDPRWEFRNAACWSFSIVGNPDDVPRLMQMESDSHPSVRANARRTLAVLARIEPPCAFPEHVAGAPASGAV